MNNSFKDIGISYEDQIFIVAEAGDNHMGKIEDAIEMCRLAKLAGASCIKFQHHLPDEEMLKDIPMSDNFEEPLYDFLVKNALKLEDHIKIKDYCQKIGIKYLCTPFSFKAAVELNSIGVDFFKIGSGEMTDHASLEEISKIGKPIILSTGMSTLDEIESTYNFMKKQKVEFAFTNCVSEYPPNYEDINLGVIKTLKEKYEDILIGHSDHSPDIYTCIASVIYKPAIIEKHVILDKRIKGPDQSVSIDFNDLKCLCDGIRKVELASGSIKSVHHREKQIREWAFRSIVTIKPINKGEKFSKENIWTKRPGTGIPSKEFNNIIGKEAENNIDENVLLKWEDVK